MSGNNTFGLFRGENLVQVANSPGELFAEFQAAVAEYRLTGSGWYPVIRPIAAPPVVVVAATGSTHSQVAQILDALQRTVSGGHVEIKTTSKLVQGWLLRTYKAKAAVGQQLLAGVGNAQLGGWTVELV